jgi:hypothetical protein
MRYQNRVNPRVAAAAMFIVVAVSSAVDVRGQGFTNYGQAYQQSLRSHPGMTAGTDRYLYNQYFRSNPAVSPYISGAVLGGGDYGTGYTSVTRPEIARREANAVSQARYVQQRKLQGNVGYTAYPGAGYMGASPGVSYRKPVPSGVRNPGAYQNHWYGAWNR